MGTIASAGRDEWPKNFYDTGGGSFGLVPASKLQSGVIWSTLQLGANGPILNGATGTITTNSGQTIGPVDPTAFVTIADNQTINGLKIFNNDIIQYYPDGFFDAGPTTLRTTSDAEFNIFIFGLTKPHLRLGFSGTLLQDNSNPQTPGALGVWLNSKNGIRITTQNGASPFPATIKASNLTAGRAFEFPDSSGTFLVGPSSGVYTGAVQPRVSQTASSATPTINTDNTDVYILTALAVAITSFTTNLSGTPVNGQKLHIAITDNGTSRAIAWGAKFEASTVALPTATTISTRMDVDFIYNTATAKWRCIQVA